MNNIELFHKIERIKVLKAMEFIVRHVNDEDVFERWLRVGVADGDIEYGDLSVVEEDLGEFGRGDYIDDDKTFSELMGMFLSVMNGAIKSGGLYCDGVVSKR